MIYFITSYATGYIYDKVYTYAIDYIIYKTVSRVLLKEYRKKQGNILLSNYLV